MLFWSINDSSAKDHYDAVSGASVSRATQNLTTLVLTGKNKLAPKGLKALLLYAVSAPETATADALNVTQSGKRICIQFVHRGNAYRIESDERGVIDIEKSFFIAENVAENKHGVFSLIRSALPGGKPALLETKEDAASQKGSSPQEDESDLDEHETEAKPLEALEQPQPPIENGAEATGTAAADSALQAAAFELEPYEGDATDMHNIVWEQLDFESDTASTKATTYYTGTLRARYKNGILTLRGTLKPVTQAADKK